MAGTSGNFNSAAFRTAIQRAMSMGQPSDVSQQVTFVWPEQDDYTPEGPDHDPYDWSQQPTAIVHAAQTLVVQNCAVEYANGAVEGDGGMGGFDAAHATVTLLDEDYTQTIGAKQVILSGYTYTIDPPGPVAQGLFDVTVWQYRVSALS